MWERLKAFLQRVWNRITGKQAEEASDKDLLKVFKLLSDGGNRVDTQQFNTTAFGDSIVMSRGQPEEVSDRIDISDVEPIIHASYANRDGARGAAFASNLNGDTNRYTEIRNAYAKVTKGNPVVGIRELFEQSGLTLDEFKNQMQDMFDNGQALVFPANELAQQNADVAEFGVFGKDGNPAQFVVITQDPHQEFAQPSNDDPLVQTMMDSIAGVLEQARQTGWTGIKDFELDPKSQHTPMTNKVLDAFGRIADEIGRAHV